LKIQESKDNFYDVQIGNLFFCSKENKECKLETYWKNSDGEIIKKLPEEFKNEYLNEIKDVHKHIKDAQFAIKNYTSRIENFYWLRRKWNYVDWCIHFLDNGLIGIISKKLIWFFEDSGKTATAILMNGQWLDQTGTPIEWLSNSTKVELWHPLGFDRELITKWKLILEKWKIKQPFKQVYREVYKLTDAEIETTNYSNRFSSHILTNHQFGTLLKIRNWKEYNPYHDGGHPKLVLKEYKINAILGVEIMDNSNRWGSLAITSSIAFYNSGGPMDLKEVPSIIFSEVMRDIDLFVSVCSIGNYPNWVASQAHQGLEFNSQYVFGDLLESAKIRKGVLESIISKLKISKRLELQGNYLIVKGDLRTYKIHIGSSNILMEPNNQYLCIVPNNSLKLSALGKDIFLPFDGDFLLSLILSKAVLLADDLNITDPLILNQINLN
jgi:Domain of unknown function (DUF4132)